MMTDEMKDVMCSECGDGSHWEGCEDVHWDCRIVQLEADAGFRRMR